MASSQKPEHYGDDELEIHILRKEVSNPSVEQLPSSANLVKERRQKTWYFNLKIMLAHVL